MVFIAMKLSSLRPTQKHKAYNLTCLLFLETVEVGGNESKQRISRETNALGVLKKSDLRTYARVRGVANQRIIVTLGVGATWKTMRMTSRKRRK